MAKINKKVREEISKETEKLVHEWEDTGEIDTGRAKYHPKSKEKAIKQALAIEYGKHHVGRARKKKD